MSDITVREWLLMIYGTYLVLISIATFFTYFADKQKAKRGAWRIPERTLLLLSFFGGAFGGLPAMLIVRHKTRGEHWYFYVVNMLEIIIHSGLLYCISFVFFK